MYIILDNKLQRIGTLSNHSTNGTPFYNDQITQQIADDDQEMTIQSVPDTTNYSDPNGNTKNWGHTLDQIYVPYGYPDTDKIAEGNSLAYQDPSNHHWYIMRLTSVNDTVDQSGDHYKEATGVNLCIWKLGKTVHYIETLENANSTRAFGALFDDTGWYVDPHAEPVGGSATIQFDGTSSSQSMLQQLCQIYGAEVDAYVLFPQTVKMQDGNYYSSDFQVALKRVEISHHLGTDNGDRIVYGRNATNISRTVVDDNLYTRLYVYGPSGATCSCRITNNEPFVQDDVANATYNPALGDSAENYLEGAITSQTMTNPERLAQWGLQQLKIFNHPRANYTVSVSQNMNDEHGNKVVTIANLGDTFRIIDRKMDPVLHAEARVIRKTLSFANPTANSITLGEYTTVNVVPPNFIRNLQQGEKNRINEILDEIKHNPGALTCSIDKPDGCTWHTNEAQKKFIAHIYVLGDDITNLIQPQGYIWHLYQNGQINNEFTQKHANDGQVLTLTNNIQFQSDINTTNATPSSDDINSDSSNNNLSPSSSSNNPNNIDNNTGYYNDNGLDNEGTGGYNNNGFVPYTPNSPVFSNTAITTNKSVLGTKDLDSNYSLDDDSDDSDDDTPGGDDSIDLNSEDMGQYLVHSEDVTGEIRLVIDTDYISNQQNTNFNTNRIQHVFTVGSWRDYWGDDRVGALQYINYNPKDNYYYASLVYYGRNRVRKSNGSLADRTGNTEIARLDSNGNYQDSMIILFSHHNSNFGLDYTSSGGPYIWTTIKDYYSNLDQYWLVRIPYQPNTVVQLSNLSNDEKIMSYGEEGCMTYYDNSSDIVLFSHDSTQTNPTHPVDFYHAQDLLNKGNNAKPFKTIELTDYGFTPKIEDYDIPNDAGGGSSDPEDYSSQQTFQSSCLKYPYYFFDSGNVNMSDQRMVYCIDIKSGTEIFAKDLDMNLFDLSQPNNIIGQNPGSYVFAEPETLNWVKDSNNKLWFLYGLNVGYENDKTKKTDYDQNGVPTPDYIHYEQLYKVGFDLNNSKASNNNENQPDHSENGRPQI